MSNQITTEQLECDKTQHIINVIILLSKRCVLQNDFFYLLPTVKMKVLTDISIFQQNDLLIFDITILLRLGINHYLVNKMSIYFSFKSMKVFLYFLHTAL